MCDSILSNSRRCANYSKTKQTDSGLETRGRGGQITEGHEETAGREGDVPFF